jgi:hypothetical protein
MLKKISVTRTGSTSYSRTAILELSDDTFIRLYFGVNGEVYCSRKENMSYMDKFIREHDSYPIYENGEIRIVPPEWYESTLPECQSIPQILEAGEEPAQKGKRGRPRVSKKPVAAKPQESCGQHPTYHGLRKPQSSCTECEALYNKKQGEKHAHPKSNSGKSGTN